MSRGTRLTVFAVLTLLIAAVGFTTPASAAPAPKVNVCHVDDEGNFKLINISQKAYAAHIGHGDGTPGGTVPGTIDTFGKDCTVIPAAATAIACADIGGAYSDDGTSQITCGPITGLTLEEWRIVRDNIWIPACLGTPGATSGSASFTFSDPTVSSFGCRYS